MKTKLLAILLLGISGLNTPAASLIGPAYLTATTAIPHVGSFTIDQIVDGIDLNTDSGSNGFVSDAMSGTITLTFSSVYNLTAFTIANDINLDYQGIQNFALDFYDFSDKMIAGTETLTAIAHAHGDTAADTFTFPQVDGVKKVRLVIDNTYANNGIERIEVREVGFVGEPVAVPEPSTIALLAFSALGLLCLPRLRRSKTAGSSFALFSHAGLWG